MNKKYLDDNGLIYLWQKIANLFVKKENGKGLSTNDLTNELVIKINDTSSKVDLLEANGITEEEVQAIVNAAVANINKKEIVTSTDEMTDPNTIYLIASETNPGTYTEYIVVNGVPEMVGSTEVDLSGYLKTTDIVAITNSEIDTIVAT